MYRRPKFLELLHEIREQMSREADYDMDLFAEMARSGMGQEKQRNNGKATTRSENLKLETWDLELKGSDY